MIKVEHKGTDLVYDENENIWRCKDYDLEKDSLAILKKAVSAKMAEEMKQKNVTVYVNRWGGSYFRKATLTSYTEDGKDAWLKNNEDRRFKEPVKYLQEYSDENKARIKSIENLEKEKVAIDKKIGKIIKEFTKFKKEESKT